MSDKLEDVPEPAAATATATDVTVVTGNTTETSSAKTQDQEFIAKVCAWVAFILINSAFVALISWGSLNRWYIGFALCIVYVILLLIAGILLKRRNDGKNTVLTSLIFFLAVIATAVTGIYLPLNVFPCHIDPYYYYSYDDDITNTYQWVTETGDLPSEVQSWWEDVYSSNNNKNVVYLNTTGVTLFTGTDGQSYGEYLYLVDNGKAPELVTEIRDPQEFVLVNDALACFIFGENKMERKVACTDGIGITQTEETFRWPHDLFYSNELLWFRSEIYSQKTGYGNLLHSMDPFSPREVTLHSSVDGGSTDDGSTDDASPAQCSYEYTNFIRFISWLFLSAIPALIAAIAIDFVHKVPTMPIGKYLSTMWLMVCIIFTIDPTFDELLYDFFRWWSVLTAGPWLVLLTLSHLTNRITKCRLGWSSNFAALVYTGGAFILLDVFWWDGFWRWAVLTVVVVPGLFFMSIVTGQIFLMIIAAVVIMIDVWRLTDYIVYDVGNWNNSLPAQFVVLALSGLLLGFLGFLLGKRQSRMQTAVSNWAKSKLSRWVIASENDASENGEGSNNNETNDAAADVVADEVEKA